MSNTADERIARVKYGILSKVFFAGSRWRAESYRLEKEGKLDAQSENLHYAEANNTVLAYWEVVDLIWGEFPDDESVCDDCEDDVCKECRQKLEDQEIVDKLDKELKKKKDS
jgi:hypothetical protein